MEGLTSSPPTVGQQLDAFLEGLQNLDSTHKYLVAFATCLAVSFVLLNSGQGRYLDVKGRDHQNAASQKKDLLEANDMPQKADATGKKSVVSGGREPRWYIFKILNYVLATSFLASVVHFLLNSEEYIMSNDHIKTLGAVWTLFVLYFWGFFGVSFVDTDEHLEEEESSSSPSSSNHKVAAPENVSTVLPPPKAPVHPPAPFAPVCSDPSTQKASSSKTPGDISSLSNEELANLVLENKLKDHKLETELNPSRAVPVRRLVFEKKLGSLGKKGTLNDLPYEHDLSYERVFGANCEIVVGYVPLPVGMVGPCTLNGESVYIPMATTEGCLVASTNRGCKAISAGGGAVSTLLRDGITRAPCLRFESAAEAAALAIWVEETHNFLKLKNAFESTTSFGKLLSAKPTVAGKNCYLRLKCFSGDAMGMNMVSKGSLAVVELLRKNFPTLKLVALSGNMCTDKKAAATNWIEGRGKSVVVEATIPKRVVRTVLKTTVKAIVDTNLQKNLVGSAMSGTLGGFNAHASNIVTAVFLATGQDPAQNVESSNCLTLMEETKEGDLWISCTMPSIEVGTVGGGTSLPAQAACLKAIGVKGGGDIPGSNARKLAHVVAVATMAGELSLLAALAANTLVQAHMQHNRKPATSK